MMEDSGQTNLSDDDLWMVVLGDAPAAMKASISSRLAESPSLRARVARMERTMESFQALRDGTVNLEVSADQRARLIAIATPAITPLEALAATVENVTLELARVLFDSWKAATPTLGFRGALGDRHLQLQVRSGTVDLRISRDSQDPGKFWVIGQCENTQVSHVSAFIAGSGTMTGEPTACGADGYFELALEQGLYDLRFESPGMSVVVRSFEVGEARGGPIL
jgi:hypothetical protein